MHFNSLSAAISPTMNRILLALVTITLIATPAARSQSAASEIPPKDPWYLKSIQAPAYVTATAHDPNYNNKELWPAEMQKAAFVKQPWPKTRVLVWAKPGGGETKDGWEAKYWLENGKPTTEPFDEDTDLVFPDFPSGMYWVHLTEGRKYQPASFRHLTVGRGAGIIGHFSVGGNTWIRQGGMVRYLDSTVGKQNTFLRNDNGDIQLVDHFHFKKVPMASCELIGKYSSDDNWQIYSGLMILAPDSHISAGNRTDPEIHENAALALMSGAYFTRRLNCDWGHDLIVKGKFSAGLPDRPLTRDARLGLGYKSKGSLINNTTERGNRTASPDDFGMLVVETGSFKVFTAAPAEARLIINCHKLDQDAGQLGIQFRNRNLDAEQGMAKAKAVPKLTDMLLLGDADMSNVQFDDILKGGIRMIDPTKAKRWSNVTFGTHNGGNSQELVSKYQKS